VCQHHRVRLSSGARYLAAHAAPPHPRGVEQAKSDVASLTEHDASSAASSTQGPGGRDAASGLAYGLPERECGAVWRGPPDERPWPADLVLRVLHQRLDHRVRGLAPAGDRLGVSLILLRFLGLCCGPDRGG
jgi:hypothetical protein